ncbi:MAG TPA: hypothetical protein VI935_06290 [Thermodesulfobacteriota bacterium]|nr:hypothetical protein [Thermodesulfobacteriota bacterium]
MKRMLIIGNEHPGIKSVPWTEVTTELIKEITDFQVLLIDLDNYSPIITETQIEAFGTSVVSLVNSRYPVVYLLPRINFSTPNNKLFPFDLSIEEKFGVTLEFNKDDEIIRFYKTFVTKHEIILTGIKEEYFYRTQFRPTCIEPLIRNNIKELCGIKLDRLYLLHPPDRKYHKQAIKSLVEYFSPDIEEEKEEKQEWVSQYESVELGLDKLEAEIKEVELQVEKLIERKEEKEATKEKIAKWSDLLTRQGKTLELRLKEAFEFLGVEKVEHEPKGSHGPDLVIHHNSIGLTIEVEGSKGPIRIDKARELLQWIADAPPEHKGVLIGNPFRELPPKERPPETIGFSLRK